MSLIGMAVMWGFAFIVFLLFIKWPMGKASDNRTTYWSKYEGK